MAVGVVDFSASRRELPVATAISIKTQITRSSNPLLVADSFSVKSAVSEFDTLVMTRRSVHVARELLNGNDDDDDIVSELQAVATAVNVNVDWGAAVLPMMTAFVLANFITLAMLFILYFNFLLFGDYFWTILWAVLISEALQSAKGVILEGLLEVSCPERRPGTSLIVAASQVSFVALP
jgi:hypothetical protein